MAENTQKQTAATDTTPGQTPAGSGTPRSPVPPAQPTSTEQDLESLLASELGEVETDIDSELDGDLPQGKGAKKDKQATDPDPDPDDDGDPDPDNSGDGDPEPDGDEDGDPPPEDPHAEIGDDEEVDPEKPPKGFENVPKGIWKRQNKLIQKQRELKAQLAQGAIVVTPTPANPLADVADEQTLTDRVESAKLIRAWLKENPDGGTLKLNGKDIEISPEEAGKRLAKAEAVIESAPEARALLKERAANKPWVLAEAITPGLFDKTTQEHRFMSDLMATVPELTKHPEWEVFVAAAARGMRQVVEERTGKAKYVRYELDKDGKMIPPKKSGDGAGKEKASPTKAAVKPAPTPSSTRPAPVKTTGAKVSTEAHSKAVASGDLAAALAAELGEDF